MSGGYCGTLLDVDLTEGTVTKRPLPEEKVLRTWIGGAGLGVHLLCQNIRRDAKASDPETPIIVMTGPLTGTKAPSSSDWKIITLNPFLEYHPVCSQGHGHFGARLKHAGYDGIIIRGKSAKPVYLWIDDDHVEVRDAEKYWGMDTFETQHSIAADHKDIDNISVACIGPAGERAVPGASVRADKAYGANKGSCGMVFGFKNLKAIGVRGTKTVPVHDLSAFLETCEKWRARITEFTGFRRSFKEPAVYMAQYLARGGWIPFNNFLDADRQVEWGKRWAEDTTQWKVEAVGSWECDMKCHHDTMITTGPCAGTRAAGYGPENFEGAATMVGIVDPGTCLAMANFYDAMGCDPCDAGHLIALAFEMYNKGLLTEEETGGLKLEWGNDEAARELFFQMLNREALGAILAKGFRKACDELGRGAKDMIMHVKGVGHNDHDLRGLGLLPLLGEMVSGAGPTWQGFFVESAAEPDLGYPKPLEPNEPEGKALAGYLSQVKKLFTDCTGECWFASFGVTDSGWLEPLAVSQATGFDISMEEAHLIGERVVQLFRLFAVARGFKKEYDLDVAPRLLEQVPGGPAKGRAAGSHVRELIDEYYGLMGWDFETGRPSKERLAKVGLTDYTVGRSE
jgi:aldehyde:ferredoxin oxidoreductase